MLGATGQITALETSLGKKGEAKRELIEEDKGLDNKIEELSKKVIQSSEKVYATYGRELEEKKARMQLTGERAAWLKADSPKL